MKWIWCLAAGCFLWSSAAVAGEFVPEGSIGFRHRDVVLPHAVGLQQLAGRPEARVSLGFSWAGKQGVSAAFGLRTGDPRRLNAPWSELGSFGASPDVSLYRAWFGFSPDVLPEVGIKLGYQDLPWSRGGLIWDRDLALPGASLSWNGDTFEGSAALWYLATQSASFDDETLGYGGRAAWKGSRFRLDAGYFGLQGARRLGRAVARGDVLVGLRPAGFSANTTDTDDTLGANRELTQRLVHDGFASDFHLVDLAASVHFALWEGMPSELQTHLVYNLGADDDALGAEVRWTLGESEKLGEAELGLRGVWLESDAVLDLFNEDLYGTNLVGGGISGSFHALQGLHVGFESLIGTRIDKNARGLGDGRGEPRLPGKDPLSIQVHTEVSYAF